MAAELENIRKSDGVGVDGREQTGEISGDELGLAVCACWVGVPELFWLKLLLLVVGVAMEEADNGRCNGAFCC